MKMKHPISRSLSWIVLAMLVVLTGCKHRVNTQIVVRIDSDLRPMTELTGVHVVVRRPNRTGTVLDRTYTLGTGTGMFQLPGEVGIVASDSNDTGTVTVEVSAVLVHPGTNPLLTRATTAFESGHTLQLPMFLARSCTNAPACPMGQTCGLCGCEPESRTDLADLTPSDASDVGTDATMMTGTCNPAHPPSLPGDLGNRSICGDAGLPSRVFAASSLSFGFPPHTEWRQNGFDFDNLCTDPSNPMSGSACTTPGSGGIPVEDGDQGRDNAFSSRVGQVLEGSMALTESRINQSIQRGQATVGVRITGYGGGPDDGQVTLELLPLVRGHRLGMPGTEPAWDGTDEWSVDSTIAYDPAHPGVPAVRVDTAYAVGGMLVARLQSHSSITLLNNATSYVRLTVSGGVISGPISAGGASLGPLEVGGWMTLADLRNDIVTLGLCPGSANYMIVSSYLDSAADMYVVGDNVTVSPAAMCNAISLGFGTTWTTVTLTPVDESDAGITIQGCDAGTMDGFTPPDGFVLPDALPDGIVIPDGFPFPG